MKILTLIFWICSFFLLEGLKPAYAQFEWSADQKLQFKEANYYYKITNYIGALEIYRSLYKIDSTEAELNHKIAVCIFQSSGDKLATIPYFERAVQAGYIESLVYLGRCYHIQGRFDDALVVYQRYKNSQTKKKLLAKSDVDRYIGMSNEAGEWMREPSEANIENLECSVNSEYSDYRPLISADESVLIFTSRRKGSTGGALDPYNHYFEDIYITHKEAGEWSEPQKIDSNINSSLHDAGVGVSSDGSMLIIFKTNEDLTGGDLYWSSLSGDRWDEPNKFGPNINTEWQETSASLSPDGRVIYFSSNRPGGYGGKDLYRVVKLPHGAWSLPLNLGATINSPYDDDAPFIHADGQTLYYSSKGHRTMGGYDIFKSSKEMASIDAEWTEPENMGYPINTVGDDIHFTLSADGYKGYYASTKEGSCGGQDIYVVSIPFDRKALILIKGVISSTDSLGTPIKATMVLVDEENLNLTGIYNSNSLTGKFLIIAHPGKKYNLLVKAPGYLTYTEDIHITDENNFEIIQKQIKLNPKHPNGVYQEQDGYTLIDKKINMSPDSDVQLEESLDIFGFTMVKLQISSDVADAEPLDANLVFVDEQTNDHLDIHNSASIGKYMVLINPDRKYILEVNVKGYKSHTETIDYSQEDTFTVINKMIKLQPEE